MSKHIYIVSYPQGMFGEFLCRQISKDTNYWDPIHSKVYDPINKHLYISKLNMDYNVWPNEFGYNLGGDYINHPWINEISNELRDKIDVEMSHKNDILRTHAFFPGIDANLPRIKKIRFYVDPIDIDYVLYMSVIKCAMTTNFDLDPFNGFVKSSMDKYNKFPELTAKFFDNFQKVTDAEWYMMMMGIDNTHDYVCLKNKVMNNFNDQRELFTDWTYINPLALLRDPESNIKEWQILFDMKEPLDVDVIKQYKDTNDSILEQTFGMSYSNLKKLDTIKVISDCLDELLVVHPRKSVDGN